MLGLGKWLRTLLQGGQKSGVRRYATHVECDTLDPSQLPPPPPPPPPQPPAVIELTLLGRDRVHKTVILPYRVWAHAREDWKWSEDLQVYVAGGLGLKAYDTRYLCLGDRLVASGYGELDEIIIWSGSSSECWHCTEFRTLGQALDWVQSCKYAELGTALWAKGSGVLNGHGKKPADS